MGTLLGQVLVEQGHLTRLKCRLTIPVLKVGIDAPRMDNLVRRGQREVEEAWDRDRWNTVCEGHGAAGIMDTLDRITGAVEVFLGPNDIDTLSVVDRFADEGDILEREEGDVPAHELLSPTKRMLSLPIEGTLAEDGAK